jgi:hypothetical protein
MAPAGSLIENLGPRRHGAGNPGEAAPAAEMNSVTVAKGSHRIELPAREYEERLAVRERLLRDSG